MPPLDLRDPALTARTVIAGLALVPHPEGGHWRETWRDVPAAGGRGVATAILFLLEEGESSHWHRVDAAELWIWQAGAPLGLAISGDGGSAASVALGPAVGAGELLHALVPAGAWQAAKSRGAWTLATCVVAPAFSFDGFELAPADWQPPA